MANEGATQFGSIKAVLTLDKSDYVAGLKAAGAQADELGRHDPKIHVEVNATEVIAQLKAIQAAENGVDQSSRNTSRGMRALATAIIALGPAVVPLAAATVGLAAGFGAMGTAGILAIVGIRHEMQEGTTTGQKYTAQINTLKDDLDALGKVAADGVLEPFAEAVHNLQTNMPALTRIVGDFSTITGRTASNVTTGLVAAFVSLEPLMRDVAVYTLDLSGRFKDMMSGPGIVAFGDYVRSVFPQVMDAIESIVGAAIHLVAALSPLGLGILTAIQALSSVISAIPVDTLSAVATVASAVFLGFKSYGLITGLVEGVSGALVRMGISAGVAAAGMAALNIAAAGIGAIIAVATFLYTKHANAVREDQQTVDDYTDALRRSNGVIDENVRAKAFQILSDNGAYAAASRLGISLGLVTDASLGNVAASRQVAAEMAAAARAQDDFEAGGQRTGRTAAETNGAINDLNSALGTNTRQVQDAQKAQKQWAEASKTSTAALTEQDQAAADLAGRLGVTTTSLAAAEEKQRTTKQAAADATLQMQLEGDAAGLLKQQLDLLNGKALSAEQAQNAFDSALANSNKHIAANGKTIDRATTSLVGNSAAAVANRGEILRQIEAAQNAAEAFRGEGHSQDETTAKMNTMKAAIIQNAREHGLNTKQVQAYIDKLFKVPAKLTPTKVELDQAAKKKALADIAALREALSGIKDKSVVVTATQRFVNNTPRPGGGRNLSGGSTFDSANGNIFAFGSGGFSEPSHIASILPAGAMRLSAEPETGGEAYIPLAPSKRGRSSAILAETNRLMGDPLGARQPKGGDTFYITTPDPLAAAAAVQARQEFARNAR